MLLTVFEKTTNSCIWNISFCLDEFSLKWGKSLRKSIDEGLLNSLFGIVILSKVFFRKTWTKMELDGLTTIMTTTGQDNILPLRFGISNEDVAKVSPHWQEFSHVLGMKE